MTGTHVHVADLAELRRFLEASGEKLVVQGDATTVVASVDGHDSNIQVIWRAETGTLHLVEILAMVIPPAQTNDLVSALTYANAQLGIPGFQLRKQPAGWKVAYATCAFLDHDGKISSRVVVELIKAVRIAVREALPALRSLRSTPAASRPALVVVAGDRAIYDAAVDRARDKLAKLAAKPAAVALADAERSELARVFERDLRRFAGRVAGSSVTEVGAPFFLRSRILRLESGVPPPAQAAYAALTASGAFVLSGNPSALARVCADEPPAHAGDPDLALVLANLAGVWTGASLLSELPISSIDDVPFRRATPDDHAREAEVRRSHGDQVAPVQLEQLDDGVRVTSWLVSESRLRRRVAEVRGGVVMVDEQVVAELPVHPGRYWGNVNGRLVPVG